MHRLLGDALRIRHVLGVGGKQQVWKRFSERAGRSHLRREFYLVDGDFDDLIARDPPESMFFYRLHRYDIESYLIEEDAVCTVAEEEHPQANADQFRKLLRVGTWTAEVVDGSLRLAACAALLQKLEEAPQLSQSVERYVDGNAVLPDILKIDSCILQIRASQDIVDEQEFDRLFEEMISRMGSSNCERLRWISGKKIVIPLLIRLLRKHAHCSLKRDSLCFRLATNCEFPELTDLRDRIISAAAS